MERFFYPTSSQMRFPAPTTGPRTSLQAPRPASPARAIPCAAGVRAARRAAAPSPASPRIFLRVPRLATPARAIPGDRAARRAPAPSALAPLSCRPGGSLTPLCRILDSPASGHHRETLP
ncbi:hypothetical protein PVAP13_6KG088000 [Panicum virgatum]|uniref:Uncharacterized protein n=1 Tax=Panicum virgatum TaxID=38727 RepID=A0A8T0R8M5_PANVG|nr:hypothetical protein PVAP13_6KG088000 [Panicum virgatum]